MEDHLQKLRDEEGIEKDAGEDNEDAWRGWDIESDSSADSSESDGWIDVDDGQDDDINISDDEEEGDASIATSTEVPHSERRVSSLATSKASALFPLYSIPYQVGLSHRF